MGARKLRVGIVGTGAIAQGQHLPHWQALVQQGRVELAAVCDVVAERAQDVAERFGAHEAFTDYAKMIRAARLDVVDVCTQNRLHCPVALAALKSGAHVLVEKPMAMNAREAQRMLDAANQHKRKLMVAQHMRFEADAEYLKRMVDAGELGEIYTAKASLLRRRGVPGWGLFHIRKESLGGPLIDVGVHVLDLTLWLMGFPKPVAASGMVYRKFGDRQELCNCGWPANYPRDQFDVEDYATALVRFEGGVTLTLETSWAANIPESTQNIWILGDKAGLTRFPAALYGSCGDSLTTTKFDWLPQQDPYKLEIEHFVGCIENNQPVRVAPEQSLQVQKIVDAIYESAVRNREVPVK